MPALPATIDLANPGSVALFTLRGPTAADRLGDPVRGLGDVNGDGIDDFLLVAPGSTNNPVDTAYVVFGRTSFTNPYPLTALDGTNGFKVTAQFDWFGNPAGAADFNGDGLKDVVLQQVGLGANKTVALVAYGRAQGPGAVDASLMTASQGVRIVTDNNDIRANWQVTGLGDFNGDGFEDVLVGDYIYGAVGQFESVTDGGAFVVFGRAGAPATISLQGLTGANGFGLTGSPDLGGLGHFVNTVGDLNGDGLGDLVAIARFAQPQGRVMSGEAYVLYGSRAPQAAAFDVTGLNGANGFKIIGEASAEMIQVSAIGDFNGDGRQDLMVGAPTAGPAGRSGAGTLYVLYGKAGGFGAVVDLAALTAQDGFRIIGPQAQTTIGDDSAAAAAGDVNGDGFDDLILSASGSGAYLVYGRAGAMPAQFDLAAFAAADGVRILGTVAEVGAADVNGDGLSDLILSNPSASPGGLNLAGETTVIFGQSSTVATIGADTWAGTAGADKWKSLGGADSLQGLAGDDRLDGGPGADKALYAGTSGQYDVWETADGTWRVKDLRAGGPEGTDTLISVESLQFSDKTVKILGLTTAETLTDAYSNILRSTATGSELTFLNNLIGAVNGSTKTLGAAITEIVGKADQTTAVAAMSYQFFLNFVPSKGGFDYLVSPQGPNPNNINSAYYQSFNIENRYINFAVNLGKVGEGAPSFLAEYGAKTLFQATQSAYIEIFGGTVTDGKINTILDTTFQIAGQTVSRAQYFALYGGDGLTGIGTKAAMVGWLLTEAAKADVGMYANSSNAFLTDLADGAQTLVDVVGTYGKAEYIFNG